MDFPDGYKMVFRIDGGLCRFTGQDLPGTGFSLDTAPKEIREANTNFDLRHKKMQDGKWMAAASLFERQTSSLNCLNLQQRIRTGQGVQGSSCFSRTSSRALSRKSTRRTANFWMWEPQTSERLFPGAVTVGSQAPQAAGLQFHSFSMTGVAKPSGWIRGRQVPRCCKSYMSMNSTAEIGEMLHTLCLLVHFYCCTLAWHFVSLLRPCQLLKAHEEQLLQLRSAQVWLHPTPILSCHHVAKIVEEPWPWFAMRKFQRRFCPCFLCLRFFHSEHPGTVMPIEEQALRDWRTEYDKVPRLDSLSRCRSQSFAAKNCRRGVQPAEIRWLEVWRSVAPAGRATRKSISGVARPSGDGAGAGEHGLVWFSMVCI